ncbi:MAG: hypothetical protein OXR67_08090 [Chloroflexota bacterium]|nr:hypothetical protein [Chloroflexota bacterium]
MKDTALAAGEPAVQAAGAHGPVRALRLVTPMWDLGLEHGTGARRRCGAGGTGRGRSRRRQTR